MKTTAMGENTVNKPITSALKFQRVFPFLGLVFVIGLFAVLTGGKNLAFSNIQRVSLQSVLLMICCLGATFTLAHGGLDFALGGILGMSIAVGGLAGMINPILTIPVILIVAVLGELLEVITSIALNIPSFIVSLAMMFITKGILVGITQKYSINSNPIFLKLDYPIFYYVVLMVVFILALVFYQYTKIGKYNRAIGSNFITAVTSGIPVNKYKILAFLVSGLALGISAFLNFVRAGSVSATTGAGFELNALIALVLGGNSISGGTSVKIRSAIIGCLTLVTLENGLVMKGIEPATVGLIKGIIFLTAIAVAYDRKIGRIIS